MGKEFEPKSRIIHSTNGNHVERPFDVDARQEEHPEGIQATLNLIEAAKDRPAFRVPTNRRRNPRNKSIRK